MTKGEVLAMRLAAAAGIDAATARLVDSDGVPVAVIGRFDRPAGGGRIPYVSAATMLAADGAEDDARTYTDIVDAIRIHGAAAQSDLDELWRRVAFSIAITNVDDHLHNHGFLHVDRGRWRLAPAFDLNPFPERVRELKTWISADTGPEASVEALRSVAPYFRIGLRRADQILDDVERAVATWRKLGRSLGMTAGDLDGFADAFEHAERQR